MQMQITNNEGLEKVVDYLFGKTDENPDYYGLIQFCTDGKVLRIPLSIAKKAIEFMKESIDSDTVFVLKSSFAERYGREPDFEGKEKYHRYKLLKFLVKIACEKEIYLYYIKGDDNCD